MHSSSSIKRLRIVALLLAAAAAGCRQEPEPANNVIEEPVANRPAVVQPSAPLDRGALLTAVGQAASSAASGIPLPEEFRALDGRQFEVRIRFGCRGPSEDPNNWLTWTYDAESRTMRVQARPTISEEDPTVASAAGQAFEAAEGFWIPRPWLLQPVCPATAAVQAAAEPEAPEANAAARSPDREVAARAEPLPVRQRVGIAQFFTDSDSRTGRRNDRPYQAVHTLKEGQAIGSQGFNLVLSGRLRALPDGDVIACSASDADSPPDCVVSAEFQRVWIEQPETGEVIADWGGG